MKNEKQPKIFLCDCWCEGFVVTVEADDLDGELSEPFINISFWNSSIKFYNGKLSVRDRCRIIWYAIRGILPYTDMVSFSRKPARAFAKHILNLLEK